MTFLVLMQFGVPLYGASMLGEVLRSTDNSLACEPFQNAVSQPSHGLPPLLLAERGGKSHKSSSAVEQCE